MGLQTPGEVVEANFGENPFIFDFEGMLSVNKIAANLSMIESVML